MSYTYGPQTRESRRCRRWRRRRRRRRRLRRKNVVMRFEAEIKTRDKARVKSYARGWRAESEKERERAYNTCM